MDLYNKEVATEGLIFIAHRGNIFRKIPERENSLEYLLEALDKGYNIEFDVRYIDGRFYLGHDEPQYFVDYSFLQGEKKWVHCKNIEALMELHDDASVHCFWHDNDQYTLTNKLYVWGRVGEPCRQGAICSLPEYSEHKYTLQELDTATGICSDFIGKYKSVHNVRQHLKSLSASQHQK
jgi:hypothetical protein